MLEVHPPTSENIMSKQVNPATQANVILPFSLPDLPAVYRVFKSYDNQPASDDLFYGDYDECVGFIRKAPRLRAAWEYDICAPSGRLMSYVL